MLRLRILLLQARYPDDPCLEDERRSFAEKSGLDIGQFTPHNLLDGPPSNRLMKSFDAIMVGGSGDFYVSKGNLPEFPTLLDNLAELATDGPPTYASCFGYQLLVRALGGEVIYDPGNTEVGTYGLTLTEEGREDGLIGRLPNDFRAQFGHKDRASKMPAGIPNLAFTETCPLQAFRMPGRPLWASQFHPELDADENRTRFERYLSGYSKHMTPEEREEALDRFRDSPEPEKILPLFLKLVFG